MLKVTFTRIFILTLVITVGIDVFSGTTQGQTLSTEDNLQPLQIENDFEITGQLEHPVWQKASSVYIKHQMKPNEDEPAPVSTEVKVLYSQKNIYIGFISTDPNPDKIRAHVSDRDNSFGDDYVGLFLDPFSNNKHVYEFFVNPLGIQMDAMRTNNNENMNFDILWDSKGMLTDTGYQAVMKIPFKSLNFPEQKIQDWSVQFFRNYPRSSRYQLVWTDVKLNNPCMMCQNGTLAGLQDIESSNTVEFIPYGMSYQGSTINDADDPDSGLDHGPVKVRFGGSVAYSPTSTTSLDAVVNPDFSQVETDATQIGVNETFALFYPEKRPFFMRGADLFSTSEDLFYSRMINRPLGAGKFTQKSGNYTLALLTAYDRDTPFIVPGLQGSSFIRSDKDMYSNVLRTKYNIGSESHIGVLATTRNQADGDGFNYLGSFDWNVMLANHYYINGQVGYTSTKELQDTTLSNGSRIFGDSGYDAAFNGEQYTGTMVNAQFERQAKYYNFSVSYGSFSPTFQAQSGFINRIDRRTFEADQSLSYYPNKKWLTNGSVSMSGSWRYDFAGTFQERYIFAGISNNFPAQTQLSINYLPLNDERFRGEFFTKLHRMIVNLDSSPADIISLGVNTDFGRYVNRREDPTVGHGYNFSADAVLKPSARLELSLDYSYSTLSSLDDSETYYSGNIFRVTGRYNFTRKLFARFIGQYDSFSEQLQIYPLVYYKVNPFTKFYMGMTDNLRHFDRSAPGAFEGYKETDRQFFIKFQYLIRS